jgi:hypothetical protein
MTAYNQRYVEYSPMRPIGALIKDRNIILKGADAASARDFTQVPNFLLKSRKLSSGDKMTFAMLLSYAWQGSCDSRGGNSTWQRPVRTYSMPLYMSQFEPRARPQRYCLSRSAPEVMHG